MYKQIENSRITAPSTLIKVETGINRKSIVVKDSRKGDVTQIINIALNFFKEQKGDFKNHIL